MAVAVAIRENAKEEQMTDQRNMGDPAGRGGRPLTEEELVRKCGEGEVLFFGAEKFGDIVFIRSVQDGETMRFVSDRSGISDAERVAAYNLAERRFEQTGNTFIGVSVPEIRGPGASRSVAKARRRQEITDRMRHDWLRDIAQDAEDLLSSMFYDDPAYLKSDAHWYTTWEQIRKRVNDPAVQHLLMDLESDTTASVSAAADAVARAWLKDRGTAPLAMPAA